MKIRVVIIPPAHIRKLTAEYAKKIARTGRHHFVVDNKHLLPHITIFSAHLEQSQIPELTAKLKPNVARHKKISLELADFRLDEDVWFGWYVKPSKPLSDLRKALYKEAKKVKGIEIKYVRAYKPHITFTKFLTKRDTQKSLQYIGGNKKPFVASTVAITYDKDTQVPGIIKHFRLK